MLTWKEASKNVFKVANTSGLNIQKRARAFALLCCAQKVEDNVVVPLKEASDTYSSNFNEEMKNFPGSKVQNLQ